MTTLETVPKIPVTLFGAGACGAKSAFAIRFIQGIFATDYDPTVSKWNVRKLAKIFVVTC